MRCVLISIVLAAVSTAAFAQQYNDTDPRSNIYNNESLRRQDEIKRNEEAARAKQHVILGHTSPPELHCVKPGA